MGKRGNEGEHSMPMTPYFAICNFLCPDIVFLDLPRIPPKGFITSFIVSALITMFFGRIVLQTFIQLMSLCIRQVTCLSWKELIKLPYFLRESISHATSILALAAYLTFTATAKLSKLSFFHTDSSFWVCDKSATGHICKDKSLFTGDFVPSIFEVGSATGILNPTLMGYSTVDRWWGILHSFELTNVNYLPNSPVNHYCFSNLQNCIQMHLIIQIGMAQSYDQALMIILFFGIATSSKNLLWLPCQIFLNAFSTLAIHN